MKACKTIIRNTMEERNLTWNERKKSDQEKKLMS
jgi:hypothetical protein